MALCNKNVHEYICENIWQKKHDSAQYLFRGDIPTTSKFGSCTPSPQTYVGTSIHIHKAFLVGHRKTASSIQGPEGLPIFIPRTSRGKLLLQAVMEALPTHLSQSAADSPSDIVFKADIFDYDVTKSDIRTETEAQSLSSPIVTGKTREGACERETTSSRMRTSKENRYIAFQDPQMKRRLSSVHSLFRRRPTSGRAGDVVALNDQIARNGGTTSTYEQLPHRLQISKHRNPTSPAERVVELTRINSYLLQELTYHKDTQAADMKFQETIRELHVRLKDALKERSQKRADAESTLLSYWSIDFNDGNIEEMIF